MPVDLSGFDNSGYHPGRGIIIQAAWFITNALVLQSKWMPSSRLRVAALRAFGATVGSGVVVKPGVNVKYPWKVKIGDHSWIGEDAWIDSLAPVELGSNVCVSQGAYLCTGNHDWSDSHFGLRIKDITIEDGAWVGAKAIVLPGTRLASHSVVTAGSVVHGTTEPFSIVTGAPARHVTTRTIRE